MILNGLLLLWLTFSFDDLPSIIVTGVLSVVNLYCGVGILKGWKYAYPVSKINLSLQIIRFSVAGFFYSYKPFFNITFTSGDNFGSNGFSLMYGLENYPSFFEVDFLSIITLVVLTVSQRIERENKTLQSATFTSKTIN